MTPNDKSGFDQGEYDRPDPKPEKAARPPLFYEIPKAAMPTACKGCGRMIYFGTTKKGKPMPLSSGLEGFVAPNQHEPGFAQSHFIDCPAAQRFRK